MKQNTSVFWAAAGVIIAILVAAGFFNNPNIMIQRDNDLYPFCPNSFYQEFKINFINSGTGGGSLTFNLVTLNLSDFFLRNNDSFFIPADGQPRQLSFKTNKSYFDSENYAREKNLSLEFSYSYNKFVLMPYSIKVSCKYLKKKYSYNYEIMGYN